MSPILTSEGGVDRRRELLPEALWPVFDDDFVAACELHEEHVVRLGLAALAECGLEEELAKPATVDELAAHGGLVPERSATALDWLLRLLAGHGHLRQDCGDGAARFALEGALPRPDAAEVEAAQRALDPASLPTYRLFEAAASTYPAFLRGETTGEAALFAPDRLELWTSYFSNVNPLYAVNNTIAAEAVRARIPEGPGDVLELGGGLGSAAEALLEWLGPDRAPASYLFTELAPFFLNRARRQLSARFPGALAFRVLDMNRAFAEQGVEPGSRDLVYAVNTVHVARDLLSTLDEIRRTLRPGGWLVFGECLRPFDGVALYTEMVFQLLEAFRAPLLDPSLRPNGGFLTPEQWLGLLERAGFTDLELYPDVRRIRDHYPAFVVGAVAGRRPR
jgi:L-histidine Nalpha-methyltransferase